MRPISPRLVSTALSAFTVLAAAPARAQLDCRAPLEQQDSVATQRFAPMRQTLLTLEDIIRKNAAYQAPPEPVRMRTTIAAGPSDAGGARIFVRAYPEKQGEIQVWTKDRCDVIPQAERVAASVGQIYVFVNYSVQEQFLGGNEVPTYQGEVAGYPVYNGWIVMTRNGRLPWIPQTLRDRLEREERRRQKAIDEWTATKASRHPLDMTAQMKTYEMPKKNDPAGAERFLATTREVNEQMRAMRAEEPVMDAHLQRQLEAVGAYRATFTEAQLNAPAMWMDASGDARRRLDAQIAELQKLTPEEQQQADSMSRESRDLERQAQIESRTNKNETAAALRERSNELALQVRAIRKAHVERAFFPIQDAQANYALVNLKPGTPERAMAFKPDPVFPDFSNPFRPQVILVNFWSKSEPADNSPRSVWLRKAKETFDFPAVAALLR
ncbi:MAG: hypothetical protein U0Q11_02175 [Vicinamibacterales bacterium]